MWTDLKIYNIMCGLGTTQKHLPTPSSRGMALTVTTGQDNIIKEIPEQLNMHEPDLTPPYELG